MRSDAQRMIAAAALACTASVCPVAAQDPAALDDLPRPRAGRALLFASTDPSGGNEDHGHPLRVEPDGTWVLAEAEGPGRIARIWSANPTGELRIEVDGEDAFRGPFAALTDGSRPGFAAPRAGTFAGGALCLVPFPFARSLRVTSPPAPGRYHQITVLLGEDAARGDAGTQPAAAPEATTHRASLARADGPLLRLDGAGEIVRLAATLHGGDPRAVWLEVRYDREREAALAAPLDLLLPDDLPALAPHRSGARVLHAPLPFRDGCEVRAVWRGDGAAPRLDLEADVRALPADHGRRWLHGAFARGRTRWGDPFAAAAWRGAGHLAGVVAAFAAAPAQGLSFLEGDERIELDGALLAGTGTEDFFGGAWYFRGHPAAALGCAVAKIDERHGRVRAARWFTADPLPFARGFALALEHGGANDTPGADYATLTFWYADTPAGRALPPFDPSPPPPEWDGRTPLPALRRFAVAGPFPCEPRKGLDAVLPPEREPAAATYDGVRDGSPAGWRAAAPDAAGILQLHAVAPHDHVVVCAKARFRTAAAGPAVLWLGSDDAVRVRLDGAVVHEKRGLRGCGRDQDRVELRLTAGDHELLFAVENYRGGFALHARLEGVAVEELDPLAK